MAGTYGAMREYRDDPDFRDFRDEDPASSVSQLTEKIRSNIFKINNGGNIVKFNIMNKCFSTSLCYYFKYLFY